MKLIFTCIAITVCAAVAPAELVLIVQDLGMGIVYKHLALVASH